jgi:hypothetical protein
MTTSYEARQAGNFLRSCSACAAHIVTGDAYSEQTYCKKCRPKYVKPFNEWAAGVVAGSMVYMQPVTAGVHARSQWLVCERDGDLVTVCVLGMPETTKRVHIGELGQHDMSRRYP